ncbi:hypothetical protein POM88_041263 [Heracleum sosnowskyi]|uniref:Uncharacterized protein n=1 Tax=Heracleum sosnowskyi TaxID=360622 RepID=A0AAD8MAK3_9APIA|nr:hypothetical protein POM88_041263 [Heracleum sosnowskyi]
MLYQAPTYVEQSRPRQNNQQQRSQQARQARTSYNVVTEDAYGHGQVRGRGRGRGWNRGGYRNYDGNCRGNYQENGGHSLWLMDYNKWSVVTLSNEKMIILHYEVSSIKSLCTLWLSFSSSLDNGSVEYSFSSSSKH